MYSATFTKLDDGEWGVRTDGRCGYPSINALKKGCVVKVAKKGGYMSEVTLGEKVDTDNDCINVWRIEE